MADQEPAGFIRINNKNSACFVVINSGATLLDYENALDERYSRLLAVLNVITDEARVASLPSEQVVELLALAQDLMLEARTLSKHMVERIRMSHVDRSGGAL